MRRRQNREFSAEMLAESPEIVAGIVKRLTRLPNAALLEINEIFLCAMEYCERREAALELLRGSDLEVVLRVMQPPGPAMKK